MSYIYPENMRGKASLFLWCLRDIVIIIIGIIISLVLLVAVHFVYPLAFVSAYAFLSIRYDDISICDFITYAFKFCVSSQQMFCWRCEIELN